MACSRENRDWSSSSGWAYRGRRGSQLPLPPPVYAPPSRRRSRRRLTSGSGPGCSAADCCSGSRLLLRKIPLSNSCSVARYRAISETRARRGVSNQDGAGWLTDVAAATPLVTNTCSTPTTEEPAFLADLEQTSIRLAATRARRAAQIQSQGSWRLPDERPRIR